jgi:YidC/Oxa1 family membrane protein insertase
MDRNQVTGWILIALVFVGFVYYQSTITPPVQQDSTQTEQDDSASINEAPDEVIQNIEVSSTNPALDSLAKVSKHGVFANSINPAEGFTIIENEVLKLFISKKGGYIAQAELKDHRTYDSYLADETNPLELFKKDSTSLNIRFQHDGRIYQSKDLKFNVVEKSKNAVKVRLQTTDGKYLEYAYKLKPNDYLLDFGIAQNGLSSYITGVNGSLKLEWEQFSPRQEKSLKLERQNASVFYYQPDEGRDYLSETSSSDQEKIETPLKWISFKQQYFSTMLISKENQLNGADISIKYQESDTNYVKRFFASVDLPIFNSQVGQQDYQLYLGPNDFDRLQSYEGLELQEQLNLGWAIFRWVNQFFLYPLFQLILSSGVSVGIAIILLTLAIKLLLSPITYKNLLSSAKMRIIKPHLDKINEQNKDADPMQKQQAVMQLYKQTGVNPLAGCIPALLQMPILIALYRLFPSAIELRHSSFLWAEDLSSYDSILDLPFSIWGYGDHVSLFTLLMAASMFFYMRFNQQTTPNAGGSGGGEMQEAIQKNMKLMMNFMPFVMLFMFNGFAAGLSFYYFLSNVVSIGQTLFIKNFIVNEEKILEKINTHMSKPMKKSKWQKKLEEIQAKQKR